MRCRQLLAGLSASPNTLLDGTAVKLRLAENLTSATARAGDQVPFEVTEEVDVNGVPVIAKGAQALATVTDASPKKSMGRGGKLDVNVDSVRLLDGEKAQLRAVQDNKGGGHVGAMTGAMVATAIVFFPAAPLFLFVHGKDVVIPQGTEVTAFVQGDMKLDMAKFAPVSAVSAVAAASAAVPSTLTIDASVANCDIEVDGSFVGNTPSTLNLAPGKHDIVVKKSGLQRLDAHYDCSERDYSSKRGDASSTAIGKSRLFRVLVSSVDRRRVAGNQSQRVGTGSRAAQPGPRPAPDCCSVWRSSGSRFREARRERSRCRWRRRGRRRRRCVDGGHYLWGSRVTS